MSRIICFCLLLLSIIGRAQELNCTVVVNADKLPNANQQVFKTLQTSLNEFVNKTQWSSQARKPNEKINCSMNIILSSQDSNNFSGEIQIQSSRLVYNSSYSTPVFNFNDKDLDFSYTEFQQLIYNPAQFESNLVSLISFYALLIIGLDADTFEPLGGNSSLEVAQNICNLAQQSSSKGWNMSSSITNRYFLINDLLAPVFGDLRQACEQYNKGLDMMTEDLKAAKEKIKASLLSIGKLSAIKPNAFVIRLFFDAKADEIASIFSGGPSITVSDLVDSLNKTSPLNSSKWVTIKY